MLTSKYEFTQDWFSPNIPTWKSVIGKRKYKSVLEIGSYEGLSATWVIDNVLASDGRITCVDTWKGGVEHSKSRMAAVKTRFGANMERTGRVSDIDVREGKSHDVMASLKAQGKSFDLIYIDGSHQAPDVLRDLVYAFDLCKLKGLIICDDYMWNNEYKGYEDVLNSPKLAIDAFLNINRRKVNIAIDIPLYQMIFTKTRN